MSDLRALDNEQFCYLTTTGRVTGRPHQIDSDISDWVENLRRAPEVIVRIAEATFDGHARVVEDGAEDELARSLLIEKYERNPGSLSNWRNTALPVAVDLAT